MNKLTILKHTENFVKKQLSGEGTGHDWWHVVKQHQYTTQLKKHKK